MTSATAKSSEPTIDDILASIRRIIADEQQAEAPPYVAPQVLAAEANVDVLDLAQPVVRPSGISKPASVEPIATPSTPAKPAPVTASLQPSPAPSVAPQEAVVSTLRPKLQEPEPARKTAQAADPAPSDGERLQKLIAGEAEDALAAAFGRISALRVTAETRTLDGLVADLLRPMLKEWLDANLPAIVERLVKQEIERIAAEAGR